MSQWFVYMLECSDGSIYTGISTDLKRRVDEHNSGCGGKYTASRLPVKPLWAERRKDRSDATKRELRLKSFPRARKLQIIDRAAKRSLSTFENSNIKSARFMGKKTKA